MTKTTKLNKMKKILLITVALLSALGAEAQYTYPDAYNQDVLKVTRRVCNESRKEIVIPKVNGYTVYKTDLHTHTIFSDGRVTPEWRVEEAWQDGLDAVAITDHIENRPYIVRTPKYLDGVEVKVENEKQISVDLNASVKLAQDQARKCNILIIPGSEISRPYKVVGHLNALFTSDNNVIPAKDPLQALRNAKAQGALVQFNHPGAGRTSLDLTEFEINAYKEGLIDGIEIFNNSAFYPKAIDRALEKGLFMSANSDIHFTTDGSYAGASLPRNMTMILAEERTLDALKEALLAHRTIAYSFDQMAGEESLLKSLFNACVTAQKVRVNSKGRTEIHLTNMSSLPFAVSVDGSNPIWIDPFSTVPATVGAEIFDLKIMNMWCREDCHPVINVKL